MLERLKVKFEIDRRNNLVAVVDNFPDMNTDIPYDDLVEMHNSLGDFVNKMKEDMLIKEGVEALTLAEVEMKPHVLTDDDSDEMKSSSFLNGSKVGDTVVWKKSIFFDDKENCLINYQGLNDLIAKREFTWGAESARLNYARDLIKKSW